MSEPPLQYASGGLNVAQLMRRILSLGPDQRLVYHRGRSFETCPPLVRSAAQVAFEAGVVRLFQRHIEAGMTEWLAVGCRP